MFTKISQAIGMERAPFNRVTRREKMPPDLCGREREITSRSVRPRGRKQNDYLLLRRMMCLILERSMVVVMKLVSFCLVFHR